MIDAILAQREQTHGDFKDVARIAQALKQTFYGEYRYMDLSDQQSEALDMIASKIGRILAGNPNEVDHWRDIAGYAQLVVNAYTAASGDPTAHRAECNPATPAPVPPAFVVPGRATLP